MDDQPQRLTTMIDNDNGPRSCGVGAAQAVTAVVRHRQQWCGTGSSGAVWAAAAMRRNVGSSSYTTWAAAAGVVRRGQQQQEWCGAGSSSRSGAARAAAARAVRRGQQQRGAGGSSSSRWGGQQQQERRGAGSRSRSGVVQAAAGVGAARCGQQQQQEQRSAVLGNSPFPGDLEPGHTTRAVGWLERLESLEMQPGTDWDQLPSNPSISSCPAACHLADVQLLHCNHGGSFRSYAGMALDGNCGTSTFHHRQVEVAGALRNSN